MVSFHACAFAISHCFVLKCVSPNFQKPQAKGTHTLANFLISWYIPASCKACMVHKWLSGYIDFSYMLLTSKTIVSDNCDDNKYIVACIVSICFSGEISAIILYFQSLNTSW